VSNISKLNKVKISLLFTALIFSLMIYESGQWGFGLDIINKFVWLVVYTSPFFVAEIIIRKNIEHKIGISKIIDIVLLIPLLSSFLLCVAHLINDFGPVTAMGVYFGAPIIYAIFFCMDLLFVSVVILSIKVKNRLYPKIIYITIIGLTAIFFLNGAIEMARCEFAGCSNGDYLVARAIKNNNPEICRLADTKGFWQGFFNLAPLVPANFAPYPAIGGVNRSSCYSELAEKTKSLEICSKAGEYSCYCYQALAVSLNDVSICDRIMTLQEQKALHIIRATREECYSNFLQKTRNNLPKCSR
jgi:hypothetical protein